MRPTRPRATQRLLATLERALAPAVEVTDGDPAAALKTLPARSAAVRLVTDRPQALRVLALPTDRPPVTRELQITVRKWRAPVAGWGGRAGHTPWLVGVEQSYPDRGEGEARIVLRTSRPVEVRALIAAAYPALVPVNDGHGASPRVVVAPGVPAGVLALVPTAVPQVAAAPPSPHLQGVGLPAAELALVRDVAQADAVAAEPEERRPRVAVAVGTDGHAFAQPRRARPLVDLRVHHPIGRLSSFVETRAIAALTPGAGGGLALTVTAVSEEATSSHHDIDVRRPVTPGVIAALRDVEHVSLTGITGAAAAPDGLLAARLVELAATGAILHGLPRSVADGLHGVSPALRESLHEAYTPRMGLARDLRSVKQRATAMRAHGGALEMDAVAAAHGGHRLLPTVSVVMSTVRPARAVQVLAMLARQTYPHLEVVVAFHGVPIPELPDVGAGPPVEAFGAPAQLTFGEALAASARRASGDLIVKVDDDDWYGPECIWDLVLAYLYSGAQVVGKTTEYLHFENLDHTIHRTFAQESFHTQVAGGAMLLSRGDYEAIGGWRPTPHSTDRSILIAVARAGGVAYRTHGLGYVYVRHEDGHTWTPEDSKLLDGSFEQWPGPQPAILEHYRVSTDPQERSR